MTKIVGRTKENVASLPTWAQRRIASLEHEVAQLKADADAASTPGSPVTVTDASGLEERGLPKGAHVRFRVAKNMTIEIKLDGDQIEVRSNDGYLTILPAVSNVVYVKARASHR